MQVQTGESFWSRTQVRFPHSGRSVYWVHQAARPPGCPPKSKGMCSLNACTCAMAGALLRAVRSGDEGAVIGLIDRARANLQVTDRVCPTCFAHGPQPSSCDSTSDLQPRASQENNSSLHLAAHNGHVRVAALLLERGAQVDALDEVPSPLPSVELALPADRERGALKAPRGRFYRMGRPRCTRRRTTATGLWWSCCWRRARTCTRCHTYASHRLASPCWR